MEKKEKFIAVLSFDAFCVLMVILCRSDLLGNTNFSIPNYALLTVWFGWRAFQLKKLADALKSKEVFERRFEVIETNQIEIKQDLGELKNLVKSIFQQQKTSNNESNNVK